jgi:hypothetical protein
MATALEKQSFSQRPTTLAKIEVYDRARAALEK